MLKEFLNRPRIGYFSMEIAVPPEVPTYSGGLDILAGDTLRTATDLDLPMIAVSLVSHCRHEGCILQNGSLYNSHRMMRRYASEAYL